VTKLVLLFDLDGTLTDTDPLHIAAFNVLLMERGRSLDLHDYRKHVMGAADAAIGAFLFPDVPAEAHAGLMVRKEAMVRAAMGQLVPAAGLLGLLAWAAEHEVPCGVVTNAPRENADAMLAALGLGARFSVVVIGQELARAKPDPLPYLTGLQLLGGTAARAVAFEDSLSGVRAASGAGIFTYGMRGALDGAALLGAGAHATIADFADAALRQKLAAMLAG
jgi:beta-phosphoglucomutase-like phosphatase (HAD superfamily)